MAGNRQSNSYSSNKKLQKNSIIIINQTLKENLKKNDLPSTPVSIPSPRNSENTTIVSCDTISTDNVKTLDNKSLFRCLIQSPKADSDFISQVSIKRFSIGGTLDEAPRNNDISTAEVAKPTFRPFDRDINLDTNYHSKIDCNGQLNRLDEDRQKTNSMSSNFSTFSETLEAEKISTSSIIFEEHLPVDRGYRINKRHLDKNDIGTLELNMPVKRFMSIDDLGHLQESFSDEKVISMNNNSTSPNFQSDTSTSPIFIKEDFLGCSINVNHTNSDCGPCICNKGDLYNLDTSAQSNSGLLPSPITDEEDLSNVHFDRYNHDTLLPDRNDLRLIKLMLKAADILKLSTSTIASSIIYFHEYAIATENMRELSPVAALHLACSLQQQRSLRQVLTSFWFAKHNSLLEINDEFWDMKESVAACQMHMLRILQFDIDYQTPFDLIENSYLPGLDYLIITAMISPKYAFNIKNTYHECVENLQSIMNGIDTVKTHNELDIVIKYVVNNSCGQ